MQLCLFYRLSSRTLNHVIPRSTFMARPCSAGMSTVKPASSLVPRLSTHISTANSGKPGNEATPHLRAAFVAHSSQETISRPEAGRRTALHSLVPCAPYAHASLCSIRSWLLRRKVFSLACLELTCGVVTFAKVICFR